MSTIEKLMPFIKKLLYLVLVSIPCSGSAQNRNLGTWQQVQMRIGLDSQWSVFSEAQLRSLKLFDHFHYYEAKAGIQYQANKQLKITLGGGMYDTYAEGGNFVTPKNKDEIRIWPQISLQSKLGICKIEHRYRTEFRFSNLGYLFRTRYKLGLYVPLVNKSPENHLITLLLGDEIFFGNRAPYFERNRVTADIHYHLTEHCNLLLGFVHQFDYKILDETGRDMIQFGVIFDWPYKSAYKLLPAEQEDIN